MDKETTETILLIASIISPFFWYFLGNYNGYKWARKNPDKLYIEKFFDVKKSDNANTTKQ